MRPTPSKPFPLLPSPAGLDPNDREQYKDGTHLLPAGQRVWLECMRPAVQPLLDGNSTAA